MILTGFPRNTTRVFCSRPAYTPEHHGQGKSAGTVGIRADAG